jgi:hypothetical protein
MLRNGLFTRPLEDGTERTLVLLHCRPAGGHKHHYKYLVLPGLQVAIPTGQGCYTWDEDGKRIETTSPLVYMLNSPQHLAQLRKASEARTAGSLKKQAESMGQWWAKEENKTHMQAVAIDGWRKKKLKDAAKEAERKSLRAEIEQKNQELEELKLKLKQLEDEKQSSEEKVFYAVNAAIPRIEALLSLPEIKQKPRMLRNWSHPEFNSDEIEAAYQASISRRPPTAWAFIGACWFVSLTLKYGIETVRKYHRAVAARGPIQ